MNEEAYQHLLATIIKNARRAENANRAKSDFISNLSYGLRTTLANIIGIAQLLSMDCLLPTQQRYKAKKERRYPNLSIQKSCTKHFYKPVVSDIQA